MPIEMGGRFHPALSAPVPGGNHIIIQKFHGDRSMLRIPAYCRSDDRTKNAVRGQPFHMKRRNIGILYGVKGIIPFRGRDIQYFTDLGDNGPSVVYESAAAVYILVCRFIPPGNGTPAPFKTVDIPGCRPNCTFTAIISQINSSLSKPRSSE